MKDQLVKINEQICLFQRDKRDASLRVLVTVVLSFEGMKGEEKGAARTLPRHQCPAEHRQADR